MSDKPNCQLCGEPMPEGEEMFNYHGYSGPCPKPAEETRKKNADECAYCLDGDKPVWRNGAWVHLPTDSGVGIRECRDMWGSQPTGSTVHAPGCDCGFCKLGYTKADTQRESEG